ncbi:hypothetical protein BLSMQ_0623 [Brevibacterium aurantiacum]|uniref:Uncharacterized protein n=1 Tax=Brevibacterium aurantiacum TaxID=273384 RepID=A0A1D7W011_BREAU|nr:hypothetical protein BLSMQ_0623 [Brevibacterium aurantiacum]
MNLIPVDLHLRAGAQIPARGTDVERVVTTFDAPPVFSALRTSWRNTLSG